MEKAELLNLIGRWSTVEDISTLVVLIGVVGELVASFTTLLRSHEFRERLERLSTVLVILGIAGELMSQHWLASYNDQLVAMVEVEAATANEKAEQEHLARAKIEEHLAPRAISTNQYDRLVSALRPFDGVAADVFIASGPTVDAAPLAASIRSALKDAGWRVRGANMLLGRSFQDVIVGTRDLPSSRDSDAAATLVRELTNSGILAHAGRGVTDEAVSVLGAMTGESLHPPSDLWIVIGSKT